MLSELCTLPSHTYGNEYRFLVMHNLLRLVPEMGFCIEQVLLSRENFEVHKKLKKHPVEGKSTVHKLLATGAGEDNCNNLNVLKLDYLLNLSFLVLIQVLVISSIICSYNSELF